MDYTKKLLEVRDLHKAYSKEGVPTKALNGITFDVLSGEYLGIMGASGSGKTTLLNCIATVIKPTSGQILLSGANISAFDGAKLSMKDNGTSIPLSDLPFVFDKGFTGDTGSYLSRSTGMGLYLVQKMATDLSITVELKNNSCGGTTVTLTFPKVERPFGR